MNAQTPSDSTIYKTSRETGYSNYTLGISKGLGIEWFINDNFSFSAEYYGTIWMRWGESHNYNINTINDDLYSEDKIDNEYIIYGGGFASARMGMSMYFK